MSKSYEAGKEYAKWLVDNGEVGAGETVSVEEMTNRTTEIPEEDYSSIKRSGEEPNSTEYWDGFNEYMSEIGE